MVNVTSTEAGATVTRTADAVVVAVPLGVPWTTAGAQPWRVVPGEWKIPSAAGVFWGQGLLAIARKKHVVFHHMLVKISALYSNLCFRKKCDFCPCPGSGLPQGTLPEGGHAEESDKMKKLHIIDDGSRSITSYLFVGHGFGLLIFFNWISD